MKTPSGKESLLMCCAYVCCNPLRPPVLLWTTGTAGQFLLSVHCVKFGSVLSTVSLSIYAEISTFADECASESDSKIISVMSWFVRFLLVAIMLNTLQSNLAHTKPNTCWCSDSNVSSACPVASYCSERDGLKCSVEDGHKYECTVQKSHTEIFTAEWKAYASGPILHQIQK